LSINNSFSKDFIYKFNTATTRIRHSIQMPDAPALKTGSILNLQAIEQELPRTNVKQGTKTPKRHVHMQRISGISIFISILDSIFRMTYTSYAGTEDLQSCDLTLVSYEYYRYFVIVLQMKNHAAITPSYSPDTKQRDAIDHGYTSTHKTEMLKIIFDLLEEYGPKVMIKGNDHHIFTSIISDYRNEDLFPTTTTRDLYHALLTSNGLNNTDDAIMNFLIRYHRTKFTITSGNNQIDCKLNSQTGAFMNRSDARNARTQKPFELKHLVSDPTDPSFKQMSNLDGQTYVIANTFRQWVMYGRPRHASPGLACSINQALKETSDSTMTLVPTFITRENPHDNARPFFLNGYYQHTLARRCQPIHVDHLYWNTIATHLQERAVTHTKRFTQIAKHMGQTQSFELPTSTSYEPTKINEFPLITTIDESKTEGLALSNVTTRNENAADPWETQTPTYNQYRTTAYLPNFDTNNFVTMNQASLTQTEFARKNCAYNNAHQLFVIRKEDELKPLTDTETTQILTNFALNKDGIYSPDYIATIRSPYKRSMYNKMTNATFEDAEALKYVLTAQEKTRQYAAYVLNVKNENAAAAETWVTAYNAKFNDPSKHKLASDYPAKFVKVIIEETLFTGEPDDAAPEQLNRFLNRDYVLKRSLEPECHPKTQYGALNIPNLANPEHELPTYDDGKAFSHLNTRLETFTSAGQYYRDAQIAWNFIQTDKRYQRDLKANRSINLLGFSFHVVSHDRESTFEALKFDGLYNA